MNSVVFWFQSVYLLKVVIRALNLRPKVGIIFDDSFTFCYPETCLAAFNNNTENSETTFIVSLSLMFKRIYKKGMILEFFNSYLWTVWIIEVGFVKRSKNLNLDSSKLHRLFKMLTLHIWDIEQYTRMSIHIACSYLLFRPYSSCNIMLLSLYNGIDIDSKSDKEILYYDNSP